MWIGRLLGEHPVSSVFNTVVPRRSSHLTDKQFAWILKELSPKLKSATWLSQCQDRLSLEKDSGVWPHLPHLYLPSGTPYLPRYTEEVAQSYRQPRSLVKGILRCPKSPLPDLRDETCFDKPCKSGVAREMGEYTRQTSGMDGRFVGWSQWYPFRQRNISYPIRWLLPGPGRDKGPLQPLCMLGGVEAGMTIARITRCLRCSLRREADKVC